MTVRVYLEDQFLTELQAEVVKADAQDGRPYAVLSETIFYPEGGGQPADRGHLGSAEVVDVQTCDGEIRHFLDKSVDPGPVRIEIEWLRRWDHMQQHTAQHLLTAVALRDYGWQTT
ncbi:MAG: alanyl-tRNA editing protein, partial [Acidobacteriota bacterium]